MKTFRTAAAACASHAFLPLLISLFAFESARAQPVLDFKRIVSKWPTIELYFTATCNGQPVTPIDETNLLLLEDGARINDFDLWCPDMSTRCAISVALLFDASGSMVGVGNAASKAAGNAFVDEMDGIFDQACVIWYNSSVTVAQTMTNSKDLLKNAVNSLPAAGGTAVWDGAYAALMSIVSDGSNPCRAVVLLNDGSDNASTTTPYQVISLAQNNKIKIFTVGFGSGLPEALLRNVAELTGGRYYGTADPAQLSAIFRSITEIVFQSFQECLITYDSKCPDGALRRVDLSINGICNGSDTRTKSFTAPMDSSAHKALRIGLGEAVAVGGQEVKLPLLLMDSMDMEMFHRSTFSVGFDEACLRFKEIRAPAGSLLHGVPISSSPAPGVVAFVLNDSRMLNVQSAPAVLAELTFITGNPSDRDTAYCAVELAGWEFNAGCFRPVLFNGRVCVAAAKPDVSCSLFAPDTVAWDGMRQVYVPGTIRASSEFSNSGLDTARNTLYRIHFDPADFALVSPFTDSVRGNPAGLAPGAIDAPVWELRPLIRATGGIRPIAITGYSSNHKQVACGRDVYVAGAEPFLECSIDVPVVTADDSAGAYVPMPIPVTVTLTNPGSVPSSNARARLKLPQGLEFAAPDSPASAEKATMPANIGPGQTAQAFWLIRHDITTVEKSYQISVIALNGNVENGSCSAALIIPRLLPPLNPVISASGPLEFCEGDSVTLDAGADYHAFLWSTGATTRSVIVKASGRYSVAVTDSAQRSAVSPAVDVTVHARPAPLILAGGPLDFCEGDSVLLDAGAGYTAYLWNDGSGLQVLKVVSSGVWHARVWNSNGCDGVSDTIATVRHPNPAKPTIERTGDELSTQVNHAYQWYLDGAPLPGATGRTLVLTGTGIYTVAVFSAPGCTAVSDPFDVTTLSASGPMAQPKWRFELFPDPASDRVQLRFIDAKSGRCAVKIYDAAGRVVISRIHELTGAESTFEIDVRRLAPGIYHVLLTHQGVTQTDKFVKAP